MSMDSGTGEIFEGAIRITEQKPLELLDKVEL